MGGHALKQYETHRLDKDQYLLFEKKILSDLRDFLQIKTISSIPAYRDKESFGDLDILLVGEELPEGWVQKIKSFYNLSDNQLKKNGNVLSVGIDNFQVDLIVTPKLDFETSLTYFSWNDLGNLIGRLFHKLGIKYSNKGLSVVVRDNTGNYIIDEILLTRDSKISLSILGLSFEQFKNGFDTLEDIYKFVSSSKYFDPDIYLLHNRSNTSRVRDRKRSTYSGFLKWIKETNPPTNYSFENKTEHGSYSLREPFFTNLIVPLFPEVKDKVNLSLESYQHQKMLKSVFNGQIVNEITGLSGKELGMFMSKLNVQKNQKEEWLLNPEQARIFIKQEWDRFIQNSNL
jgi:hypothetical protein